MRRLLLDTHIWLWYVGGAKELPTSVRVAIDDAVGLCWLSPISLWELGVLVDKGKVKLTPDYARWVERALASHPMRQAPHQLRSRQKLALPQSDPADRFLAATAVVYDLTLVTLDHELSTAPFLAVLTS